MLREEALLDFRKLAVRNIFHELLRCVGLRDSRGAGLVSEMYEFDNRLGGSISDALLDFRCCRDASSLRLTITPHSRSTAGIAAVFKTIRS